MTTTQSPVDATPLSSHRLTTSKAMVEGIELEMERDPSVLYLGEDVGAYGGIFSSTAGLLDRFGPTRIIDTPISETAFIGLATGAAVEGMRPIVELMFADFMGVCLDQIYNHMAKIHYESGGHVTVPMVLTTAVGGGYSDGAQHSQCLWGTFAHLPGMKVVVPSNPYDAKGLMISAIRDDNPVVYMFHKGVMGLPWMVKNPRATADVPEGEYTVPIGEAKVVRHGSDVTVVTLSLSVHHTLDVAETLWTKFPGGIILDTVIPRDEAFLEASLRGSPILLMQKRPPPLARVFDQLANDVLDRIAPAPATTEEDDVPIPLLV